MSAITAAEHTEAQAAGIERQVCGFIFEFYRPKLQFHLSSRIREDRANNLVESIRLRARSMTR